MTKQEALKIINQVGEDFGWQMGKVGANYENGYMKAILDVKQAFDHIVEANKMVVTNADRIRNMTDEELTELLEKSCMKRVGDKWCECHSCWRDCVPKWLKEKVE